MPQLHVCSQCCALHSRECRQQHHCTSRMLISPSLRRRGVLRRRTVQFPAWLGSCASAVHFHDGAHIALCSTAVVCILTRALKLPAPHPGMQLADSMQSRKLSDQQHTLADVQRTGSLPRHAAPVAPNIKDGSHHAQPPAPLLGAKARASEKRFREQEEALPSTVAGVSASASPPAPLMGTAARASAARFAAHMASSPASAPAKPAAAPLMTAAPAPAAATSAPRSSQPAAQPAASAPSVEPAASPIAAPITDANPSQKQPTLPQPAAAITPAPTTAAKSPVAAGSESVGTRVKAPSVATAPLQAMLSRWVARAWQSVQPRLAARGINTVPLAAVLPAATTRSASAGDAAFGDTVGVGAVPLAPALATAAVTLLAALGVGAALLRCRAHDPPCRSTPCACS